MSDEGFREIQLNGKQLVFLFMAATVVLVVTFLFGVMVGRDAPGTDPSSEVASAAVSPDPPAAVPPADTPAGTAPARPSSAGRGAAAEPPAAEELSYTERLLRDGPSEEKLNTAKPVSPTPAAKPPPPAAVTPAPPPIAEAPPAKAQPDAPRTPAAGSAASDPSGPGFAVQVAISKNRAEADTLAKELIAKGYPAFVMDPAKGAPAGIYRVRIGKYKTRKDAEDVAGRLKKVEQFDPWIAR